MSEINPLTGRTEEEERFVRFIYYVGIARNILDKDAAAMLLKNDYPVDAVLKELEDYLKKEREAVSDFRY